MYTCVHAAEWARSSFCMLQQPKKLIIMCTASLQNMSWTEKLYLFIAVMRIWARLILGLYECGIVWL